MRRSTLGRTQLFHPWGHEPGGGWSGSDVSVSHFVRPRQGSVFEGLGWVPLGPVGARPVIRRGLLDPVGPCWVPTGFRGTLFWVDGTRRGSTDRSTVPYRCTIDVRTHTGPPRASSGTNGPPADRRGHRRTPFNRRLPGLGGPQLLLAQPVYLY